MFNMHKNSASLIFGFLLTTAPAFGAQPPKDRISESRAKEIALNAAPGSIKSNELEFEKKQWVYSFDILGSDQKIHEVLVNARTGKIVENKIESAAAEATELQQDAIKK